jgi:hypothetical protein
MGLYTYTLEPREYFGTTVYVPTVRRGASAVGAPMIDTATGYQRAWFRKKATPQRVPGPVFARWLVEDWQAGWCTKHHKPEDETALMEYLSRDGYERVAYSVSVQDWKALD